MGSTPFAKVPHFHPNFEPWVNNWEIYLATVNRSTNVNGKLDHSVSTLHLHWINRSLSHSIALHVLWLYSNFVVNGDGTMVSLSLSNTTSQKVVVQDPKKFDFMHVHIPANIFVHICVSFSKSIRIVDFHASMWISQNIILKPLNNFIVPNFSCDTNNKPFPSCLNFPKCCKISNTMFWNCFLDSLINGR